MRHPGLQSCRIGAQWPQAQVYVLERGTDGSRVLVSREGGQDSGG